MRAPTWKWILFSTAGRLPRYLYWFFGVMVLFCAGVSSSVLAGLAYLANGLGGGASDAIQVLFAILLVVVIGTTLWTTMVIGIKRLHDRGKSGWWLVVFSLIPPLAEGAGRMSAPGSALIGTLISIVISLWALIELGFLRGTVGPNRFGEDPIAGAEEWTVTPVCVAPSSARHD